MKNNWETCLMATRERWAKFSTYMQLMNIIAELERARVWEKQRNREEVQRSLERALELIDFSLDESKWANNKLQLLLLREEVARLYCGEMKKGVGELCQVL